MRVNEVVRNSTEQPGNDAWKAGNQDILEHLASGLLTLARIEGKQFGQEKSDYKCDEIGWKDRILVGNAEPILN